MRAVGLVGGRSDECPIEGPSQCSGSPSPEGCLWGTLHTGSQRSAHRRYRIAGKLGEELILAV